jgi:anti-sigma regulatory factor (Ser/Thr protein kinase)
MGDGDRVSKESVVDFLTVPGTLDSLELIGQFVLRAAGEAGLDRKASYRLRLAVDEIATNIVVHGYAEAGRQGSIVVSSELDDTELRVQLEDSALPFDPHEARTPGGLDRPLEEREAGGLGVFLALQGVDELRYERAGEGNRNIIVVHRPKPMP